MDRHRSAFRRGRAFWDLFLGYFLSFLPILSIITSLKQDTITLCFDPCCSFLVNLSLPLKSILYMTFRESFFKCTSNCVSLSASVFPIGLSTKICHSPARPGLITPAAPGFCSCCAVLPQGLCICCSFCLLFSLSFFFSASFPLFNFHASSEFSSDLPSVGIPSQ